MPRMSRSSTIIEKKYNGKAPIAPGEILAEEFMKPSHQPEPACPRHRRESGTNQRHCPRAFRHRRLDRASAGEIFRHYAGALDEPAVRLRLAPCARDRLAEGRASHQNARGGIAARRREFRGLRVAKVLRGARDTRVAGRWVFELRNRPPVQAGNAVPAVRTEPNYPVLWYDRAHRLV